MKHSAEYRKFTGLVDHLFTVPHEQIQICEAEYRKEVDANPNRRGPKRGSKRRKAVTPPSAGGPSFALFAQGGRVEPRDPGDPG